LDFLDAPNRVLDFFGDDTVRFMLAPALKAGRVGLKMFQMTSGYFIKTLSRFTGMEVLQELSEFLLSLAPMYEVFKRRAQQVNEFSPRRRRRSCWFTSPSTLTVDEALYSTRCSAGRMPVAAWWCATGCTPTWSPSAPAAQHPSASRRSPRRWGRHPRPLSEDPRARLLPGACQGGDAGRARRRRCAGWGVLRSPTSCCERAPLDARVRRGRPARAQPSTCSPEPPRPDAALAAARGERRYGRPCSLSQEGAMPKTTFEISTGIAASSSSYAQGVRTR
jgi:hypothetical protein